MHAKKKKINVCSFPVRRRSEKLYQVRKIPADSMVERDYRLIYLF